MAQDGQLVREARRGRQAQRELSLIEEHLEARKAELYEAFCDPRNQDELYDLKSQANALTNLQTFLKELVITGKLAESQHEGEDL